MSAILLIIDNIYRGGGILGRTSGSGVDSRGRIDERSENNSGSERPGRVGDGSWCEGGG